MGGTGKIVSELKKLMIENGVKIKINTEVKEFVLEDNKISKIITNNEEITNFDLVVCNADPPMVYSKLLNKHNFKRPFKKEKNLLYSMGLFVLFFGTTTKYNDVAHHTIWMTERFKSLLSDIFKKKKLSDDFSLYIHRPTATDTSFAPEGCDSFYVLCPVPNLQGKVNWETESECRSACQRYFDSVWLLFVCHHYRPAREATAQCKRPSMQHARSNQPCWSFQKKTCPKNTESTGLRRSLGPPPPPEFRGCGFSFGPGPPEVSSLHFALSPGPPEIYLRCG